MSKGNNNEMISKKRTKKKLNKDNKPKKTKNKQKKKKFDFFHSQSQINETF